MSTLPRAASDALVFDPRAGIERLIEIMARLRAPDGCPWDRVQDFRSIAPYTIEEACEVAEAIAQGDHLEHPAQAGAPGLGVRVEPGDLGKRMALPWQADFNECTTQGIPPDDTESYWWPAQRPLSVLLEDHQRAAWDRGVPRNPDAGNQVGDLAMVSLWKALGFVINQGTAERPNYMEVERDEKVFGPGV